MEQAFSDRLGRRSSVGLSGDDGSLTIFSETNFLNENSCNNSIQYVVTIMSLFWEETTNR